jgi:hypothetical protein
MFNQPPQYVFGCSLNGFIQWDRQDKLRGFNVRIPDIRPSVDDLSAVSKVRSWPNPARRPARVKSQATRRVSDRSRPCSRRATSSANGGLQSRASIPNCEIDGALSA